MSSKKTDFYNNYEKDRWKLYLSIFTLKDFNLEECEIMLSIVCR